MNARKDIHILYDHQGIDVPIDNTVPRKPKAKYTLTKTEIIKICSWVKSLKFPDGYTLNLGRRVGINKCRLKNMKSHGCHVFMQRLIPISYREILPNFIWSTSIEVSLLFQTICFALLDLEKLQELEKNVAILLCNLEKNFPLAFFDFMEHLLIHSPYEAIIGGHVQYKWMYPFER